MKKISYIIAMHLSLTACGPTYLTGYNYTPPKSDNGKLCAIKCQEQKQKCTLWASSEYRKCDVEERKLSMEKYKIYLNETNAKGESPDSFKNADYFYTSYHCDKYKNFDCISDYNNCYSLCGGQVESYIYEE